MDLLQCWARVVLTNDARSFKSAYTRLFTIVGKISSNLDVDDLHNVIEDSFEKRRGEICAAEEIIEELVVDFGNWVHSRNLIPTFQNICKYFHGISKSELEGYLKEQKTIDSPKASVYAEQITNKIIHNVINNVKALTDNGKNHEKIQLVNQLFSQN